MEPRPLPPPSVRTALEGSRSSASVQRFLQALPDRRKLRGIHRSRRTKSHHREAPRRQDASLRNTRAVKVPRNLSRVFFRGSELQLRQGPTRKKRLQPLKKAICVLVPTNPIPLYNPRYRTYI